MAFIFCDIRTRIKHDVCMRLVFEPIALEKLEAAHGKRIAAQLGNSVWVILGPNGPRKENGSVVEPPKPFRIN